VLAAESGRADKPVSRGIGLTFRGSLPKGNGLIIYPCRSVVSFFMRFPIDVLFVDRENRVVHILSDMRPWRISKIVRRGRFVIELPAGTAGETGTQVGDFVGIEENSAS